MDDFNRYRNAGSIEWTHASPQQVLNYISDPQNGPELDAIHEAYEYEQRPRSFGEELVAKAIRDAVAPLGLHMLDVDMRKAAGFEIHHLTQTLLGLPPTVRQDPKLYRRSCAFLAILLHHNISAWMRFWRESARATAAQARAGLSSLLAGVGRIGVVGGVVLFLLRIRPEVDVDHAPPTATGFPFSPQHIPTCTPRRGPPQKSLLAA